jgi:hypothetical protein
VPEWVPSLGIFACGCETAVLVFDHEAQPNSRNWVKVMSYAATLDGNVLVFVPANLQEGLQIIMEQGRK